MVYLKEIPVERYFRDAKIAEILERPSEARRMVITGHELKPS